MASRTVPNLSCEGGKGRTVEEVVHARPEYVKVFEIPGVVVLKVCQDVDHQQLRQFGLSVHVVETARIEVMLAFLEHIGTPAYDTSACLMRPFTEPQAQAVELTKS